MESAATRTTHALPAHRAPVESTNQTADQAERTAATGAVCRCRNRITVAIGAILLLLAAGGAPVFAQNTISPSPFQVVLDNAGKIVANACVWTYEAGTLVAASTYTTTTLLAPNTNPIRTDSAGRFAAFLEPGKSYKFVYETACTPPAHGTVLRTADNIKATGLTDAVVDVVGMAGEPIAVGKAVYLSIGAGSKTAGRWYLADSTDDYSSVLPSVGIASSAAAAAGDHLSVRLAGVISPGSVLPSTRYYVGLAGALTSTLPASGWARTMGTTDWESHFVIAPQPRELATPVDVIGVTDGPIVAHRVVYLSDGSGGLVAGRWYLASPGTAYMSTTVKLGVTMTDFAGIGSTGTIRIAGSAVIQAGGLTPGALYYLAAAGTVSTSQSYLYSRVIGFADSGSSILLDLEPAKPPAPYVQAYSSTATTAVGTGAWTAVCWNATGVDTQTMHASTTCAGAGTKLTVPAGQSGVYSVEGELQLSGVAAGAQSIGLRVLKGGTTVICQDQRSALANDAALANTIHLSCTPSLAAADYLELQYYVTAAQNWVGGSLAASRFVAARIQ